MYAAPRHRARTSTIAIILIALLVAVGIANAESASSAAVSATEESEFVVLLNAQRSAAGLPALQVDGELSAASRSWAQSMASAGAISHANPISAGITSAWEKLGENVGVGPSVGSVMDAFMNSPGHRANILDPQFTHIGVGVVRVGATLYTTHRFMKLFEAAPPPPPPPPPTAPPATPPPPPALAAAPAPPPTIATTTTATPTTTTSIAPAEPVATKPDNTVQAKPIASSADQAHVNDLVTALVAVSSEH